MLALTSFSKVAKTNSNFGFAKSNKPQFQSIKQNRTTQIKGWNTFVSKRLFTAQAAQVKMNTEPSTDAMFCFQCEQTRDGVGCKTVGVCGKTPDVAALQDLLIQSCKGISAYVSRAYQLGAANDRKLDNWVLGALFSTVTNVNFDQERFTTEFLRQAQEILPKARKMYEDACRAAGKQPEDLTHIIPLQYLKTNDVDQLVENSKAFSIPTRKAALGDDYVGLQEMVMYGLKGTAAYAHHAEVLGQESDQVYKEFHRLIAALNDTNMGVNDLLATALKVGELNLQVMELLDRGATERYGHPEPTQLRTTAVAGKCIAVSGHDLRDLEEILKQTEGKGINVYTHGELLPAHGYPGLKKYKHLVGNYGGAWQLQKLEFSTFPGSILMTTNCIIEPRKNYKDRIFTRSVVGWPGVQHIENYDFSKVIDSALKQPGFAADEKPKYTTTGFARNAVLGSAGPIIDAVKSGKLKHFFLIGGCDGAEGERNYFKEMALNAPQDSVILTLACGKYRFNKFEFGKVPGTDIPRLIDVGQCNDAYSAIQIASALANAFGTDVNGLPLSFSVSWFEQKAVAVLLTLLSLGIKNIHLGPKLPAFCTPNMLNILVDKYNIAPIGDWKADMQKMMAKQ